MNRQIRRILVTAALATGALLATGGAAHADSREIDAVLRDHLGAYTHDYWTHPADLDSVDGIFHLDLDFDGSDVSDDAGQWFHIDSRTWS